MESLTPQLVDFLESGVSIIVGTRNAALRPECVRGLGASVREGGRSVTVLLNGDVSPRVLSDLEETRQIAVAFSRIVDHRSLQLKGTVERVRPGGPADARRQRAYLAAFAEQLSVAGLPHSVVRRVHVKPCVAVDFAVEEIFVQTPGPNAGRRWEEGA